MKVSAKKTAAKKTAKRPGKKRVARGTTMEDVLRDLDERADSVPLDLLAMTSLMLLSTLARRLVQAREMVNARGRVG